MGLCTKCKESARYTDPPWNDPDPYVKLSVLTVTQNGSCVESQKTTSIKHGTTNPTWNEWVYMGSCVKSPLCIRIWDDDDDPLSDKKKVEFDCDANYTSVQLQAYGRGCLNIGYHMNFDRSRIDENAHYWSMRVEATNISKIIAMKHWTDSSSITCTCVTPLCLSAVVINLNCTPVVAAVSASIPPSDCMCLGVYNYMYVSTIQPQFATWKLCLSPQALNS